MLFKTYYSENCIPLLCRGKQINDTDFKKLLGQLIAEQYAGLTVDTYVNAEKKCVLIVDDYNESLISVVDGSITTDSIFTSSNDNGSTITWPPSSEVA